MGPNGTERGRSWSFVPFLGKKTCLGPCRMLVLASQMSTSDNLLHMPRHNSSVLVVHLYLQGCPYPRNDICARSVGSFGPRKEEKGVKACLDPVRICGFVRSVPTVGKKPWLCPCTILVASQISTNGSLLHMPRHSSSALVRN